MSTRRKQSPGADTSSGPVLHANLMIVEVAESFLLDELQVNPRLGPMFAAQLSDCVAVVKPDRGEQLIQQLLKLGHTPKIEES